MKRKVVILLAALALVGCAATPATPFDEKITDVVRVFMHEQRHYTLWIQKDDSTEVSEMTFRSSHQVVIFTDVKKEQKMWARWYGVETTINGRIGTLELHLRSVNDVNGAGWNHGKFGKGTTQVIN